MSLPDIDVLVGGEVPELPHGAKLPILSMTQSVAHMNILYPDTYVTAPFLQCIIVTFGQVLSVLGRPKTARSLVVRDSTLPSVYYCNI